MLFYLRYFSLTQELPTDDVLDRVTMVLTAGKTGVEWMM